MGLALRNHPGPYFVTKTNASALGAGHLNLAISEQVPGAGLMLGQTVRFNDLNPTSGCSNPFRIDLDKGGDVYQFEDQIVRGFVRSERINRVDQHNDLCHGIKVSKSIESYQLGIVNILTALLASTGPRSDRMAAPKSRPLSPTPIRGHQRAYHGDRSCRCESYSECRPMDCHPRPKSPPSSRLPTCRDPRHR